MLDKSSFYIHLLIRKIFDSLFLSICIFLVCDVLIEELQEKNSFLKMFLNFLFDKLETLDFCFSWWSKEIGADRYF